MRFAFFFVFSRFLQGCLVVIFNMLCIHYIHYIYIYTYLFNFQPYMLGKDMPHFGKLCFSPWVAVGQPPTTSIFHFGFHLHSKLDVAFFCHTCHGCYIVAKGASKFPVFRYST